MHPAKPVRTQPPASPADSLDAADVIPFPARPDEAVELSAEECACLELAANGHDPQESSRLLSASGPTFVAEQTVRSVQMRARHKLNARSLAHAVAIALDRGLIQVRGASRA
jgi:DNA-binding CsgD family transcriptional regulator